MKSLMVLTGAAGGINTPPLAMGAITAALVAGYGDAFINNPNNLLLINTLAPTAIGMIAGFRASNIPFGDKIATLSGLASAVGLAALGVSTWPTAIVAGAISGGLAVGRQILGYT